MSKLTKADVAVNGLVPCLVKLLESWKPDELPSEIKYRDSLMAYLRAAVPDDCRVEREYRHAGTTADLYLLWKGALSSAEVFIEIKRNLRHKAAYDRLVGQIEGLNPSKRNVVVVFVGDTDPALVGRVKAHYEKFFDTFGEDPLAVVTIR